MLQRLLPASIPQKPCFNRQLTIPLDRSGVKRVHALKMTSNAFERARSAMDSAKALPEIVVFDLDYTLWPFWCETKIPSDKPVLYPDALAIIDAIKSRNLKVAAASRTPTPWTAEAFLDKLDLRRRFDSIQLIPASSGLDHVSAQKDTAHFPRIQKETGIEYSKMLFFDDERQNIQKVNNTFPGRGQWLVAGVDIKTFINGLERFEKQASQ